MLLTYQQRKHLLCASRNTINNYFRIFRESIFSYLEKDKYSKLNGEIELDESYFGAKRVRGKRGRRGAAGKTIVFGVLKRDDKVYLEIVKNATKESADHSR